MDDKKNQNRPAAQPDYDREILSILAGNLSPKAMAERLEDYHAGDLADALETMTPVVRKRFFSVLAPDVLSDVLEYGEDDQKAAEYLGELELKKRTAVLNRLDTERLVDILRALPAKDRSDMVELLDASGRAEIALLNSFPEDEIGSHMSVNYVSVPESLSVKQAMRSVIAQAAEHDNVSTIFALDEDGCYCGALDLKDLIIAREGESLDGLIAAAFPFVYAWEPVDECIERLKDYSEDSIPVLNEQNRLLGVLTSQDLIQLIDDQMGDDYAKLAGLAAEEDLHEPVLRSVRKRLPWLVILLGLGLVVSSVVGAFEAIVQQLTILMFFQSLILDMAGNVGTQSLAVTIRVLTDENLSGKEKFQLVFKEIRVGALNGLLLGALSVICVALYIRFAVGMAAFSAFAIAGCVGLALLVAMVISSLTGTVIPLAFKKAGIDPAVASGPLITTVNDLVAVVTYYGLAWLLLLEILKIA